MSVQLSVLLDKLYTISQKLFLAQEDLYRIRRMTFEEFKAEFATEEGIRRMYETFAKACELNVQRNVSCDEIDEKVVEMIEAAMQGKNLREEGYVKKSFKTY